MMRRRQAARAIVIDPDGKFLMFRFNIRTGPFAGMGYWSLPGGAVEEGESFADAVKRELMEETGIRAEAPLELPSPREYELPLSRGELVKADERFFLVRLEARPGLSRDGLTEVEKSCIDEARWLGRDEARRLDATVYPPDLDGLLAQAGL